MLGSLLLAVMFLFPCLLGLVNLCATHCCFHVFDLLRGWESRSIVLVVSALMKDQVAAITVLGLTGV